MICPLTSPPNPLSINGEGEKRPRCGRLIIGVGERETRGEKRPRCGRLIIGDGECGAFLPTRWNLSQGVAGAAFERPHRGERRIARRAKAARGETSPRRPKKRKNAWRNAGEAAKLL